MNDRRLSAPFDGRAIKFTPRTKVKSTSILLLTVRQNAKMVTNQAFAIQINPEASDQEHFDGTRGIFLAVFESDFPVW